MTTAGDCELNPSEHPKICAPTRKAFGFGPVTMAHMPHGRQERGRTADVDEERGVSRSSARSGEVIID